MLNKASIGGGMLLLSAISSYFRITVLPLMMLSAARSRLENSMGPKSWFRTSLQKMLSSFSAIWLDKPIMMSSSVLLLRKFCKTMHLFSVSSRSKQLVLLFLAQHLSSNLSIPPNGTQSGCSRSIFRLVKLTSLVSHINTRWNWRVTEPKNDYFQRFIILGLKL